VGGAAAYTAQAAGPGAGLPCPGQDAGAADGAQRPEEDRTLVIRLTSPAIFVDPAGRPCAAPDPRLDLDGATVARSWARTEIWTGWHAASRLPKPEELCAVAGSTYRLTGPPGVLSGLAARLPAAGIGLRRAEGFGGVQIVTAPWRPPAPAAAGPSRPAGSGALELLANARELGLADDQYRWLISALRDLQLALERGQPAGAAAGLADDLLGRPAAEGFSGRQRDGLRRLFAVTDPSVLRDLSALLRAGPAAAPGAEGGR
jgi:CRISPR-associated protein Csx10